MTNCGSLPGQKAVSSFLSILPSSRFCSICTTDAVTSQAHRVCKGNPETVMWHVRAWGVAFVVLVLTLLLPFLHTWAPAEAKIHSSNPSLATFVPSQFSVGDRSLSSFVEQNAERSSVFREVPSVRNAKGCVSYSRSRDGEDAFVCDQSSVHIAMTLDTAYLRGSMAAVFSILQHASCPESIIFHFILIENDSQFRSLLQSTFPFLKFKIYQFEPKLVRDRISSSVRQALEQPLNYARNYLGDLLESCVRRVIYLDSDLVVVDDILKLWNIKLGTHTIGAPEYCHANFTKYFSSTFWMDAELVSTFKGRNPCYFNTGVMIIDLMKWRQQNCTQRIEQWMEIQKARRIYELGSLPPYLLVFAGFVEPVEHRWNQHGLGGDNVNGSCRPLHPGPVSLLHWSGEGKPWSRLDSRQPCPLDSLWAPYDLFLNTSS